jgi:hypothetical protein
MTCVRSYSVETLLHVSGNMLERSIAAACYIYTIMLLLLLLLLLLRAPCQALVFAAHDDVVTARVHRHAADHATATQQLLGQRLQMFKIESNVILRDRVQ